MKKSYLKIVILFLAMAFIFALTGNVNAAEEPTEKIIGGKEFIFANGTPLLIEERTDGNEGAIVKSMYGGPVFDVSSEANIFGGWHNNAEEVNTSIIMNGGTVKNIFGGGLHLSNTNTAKVVINGGKVTGVQGGGASSLTHGCGCVNSATWYDGDPISSPCQTKKTEVVINGGSGFKLVYGGGEGISNTENASLTINGGDLSGAWVTAGGSNGNTTNTNLNITGGTLRVVQTLNRGTIENATIKITGGTIENLYLGGESGDSSVTGRLTGNFSAYVDEPAKVKVFALGQNEGEEMNLIEGYVTARNTIIANGAVEEFRDENTSAIIGLVYKIIAQSNLNGQILGLPEFGYSPIHGGEPITFTVEPNEGYKIKSVKVIDSNNNEVELELVDGTYEFFMPESNVTVMAEFEKITEDITDNNSNNENKNDEGTKDNQEEKSEKDETPKTGAFDIALYVLTALGTIALVSAVKAKTSKH